MLEGIQEKDLLEVWDHTTLAKGPGLEEKYEVQSVFYAETRLSANPGATMSAVQLRGGGGLERSDPANVGGGGMAPTLRQACRTQCRRSAAAEELTRGATDLR